MERQTTIARRTACCIPVVAAVLSLAAWAQPAQAMRQSPPAGPVNAQQGTGQQQKPTEAQKPEAQKPAEAQKPQEEQPPRIETQVFVTAPRLEVPLKENPAATSVVSAPVLDRIPRGVGAEEVLQSVPGLKVDNQADGQRVHMSIRGQGLLTERGIRGITVLLDGLPLNDPTGFAPDLFDVDWSAVDRVEVFRGVASALYGGASAGGVVNIQTRDGGAIPAQGQASLSLGQYQFLKPFAEVGGTNGTVNYRASASVNRGDGYRLHTAFDGYNLYGKARWAPSSKTQLTAIVAGTHYYNENAEGLNLAWTDLGQGVEWARQANPDALTYNEYQNTNRITMGVTGKTRLAPDQDLSFAAYYRRTYWRESVPSSVQHRTYDTPGGNIQYTLHGDYGEVKNHLTLGSDISLQAIDDYRHPNLGAANEGPEFLSDQTINQRGVGLYALDRVDLTPQWTAMLTLRNDRIHNKLTDALQAGGVDLSGTKTFSKTTVRVGVSFNPREDVGLYASLGQGFLPPATEELANNPDQMGGFNVHLLPATSLGQEVGVRGGTRFVTYDVAFFHLTTDNDFGRYRVPSRPLETFYGNLGASRRYGVEMELGYYPMAQVAVRGAYTFSDFLYTTVTGSLFGSFTNTVMPNSPRHQLVIDAEYKVDEHWVAGVNLFTQSMQYVDPGNTMSAEGFALFNPRAAYRWRGTGYEAEVLFQARNLLSDKYIAFTEPDPDGNSFQPGPTREAFVGIRIRFGGK